MLAGMINKKLKKIYIIMQNVCDMRKEELNLQNIAEQETKNKIEDIINDYKNTTSFLENKNYIDKANNKLKKLKYDLNNKNSSRRKILENETFSALRKLKNKLKPKKIKNLKELNNIRYDFNKYATGLKINKKNIVKYWDKLLDVIFRTFKKQNPKCNNYLKRTKSNISIYNEMVSYLQKANKRKIKLMNMNGGKTKQKKNRKHKGIIQSGINIGKLKNGYEYTKEQLISGLYKIKKMI